VSAAYEEPLSPELVLDTSQISIEMAAQNVLAIVSDCGITAAVGGAV
jgi:adenylylsulfate kinase-like enzyme